MFYDREIKNRMHYRDYVFALVLFMCSWFFTVYLFTATAQRMENKYEELDERYGKKIAQLKQDAERTNTVLEKTKQDTDRLRIDINLNTPRYPFLWHVQQTTCGNTERIGTIVDHYTICRDALNLTAESVVYSFGVSDDLSLELGLINQYGVHVYAFGLSDEMYMFIEQEKIKGHISDNLHFYPWGLWYFDGFLLMTEGKRGKFSIINRDPTYSTGKYQQKPVFTLRSLMRKLGHRTLSLLKLDVDGAEYEVLNSLLEDASSPLENNKHQAVPTSQLLVQFNRITFDPKYGFGVSAPEVNKIIQRLNAIGLYTFHLEPYNVEEKSRRMGFARTNGKNTPLVTSGTHHIQHI